MYTVYAQVRFEYQWCEPHRSQNRKVERRRWDDIARGMCRKIIVSDAQSFPKISVNLETVKAQTINWEPQRPHSRELIRQPFLKSFYI